MQKVRLQLALCTVALTLAACAVETVPAQPTPAPTTPAPTRVPATPAPAAEHQVPGVFTQSFDEAPAAPEPWTPDNWDVVVHSRDRNTWDALQPMEADHSAECGAPPAQHEISAYADAVFLCKDHLMTAINASGYGVIYLTPNQLADFSKGEAMVRFDMSTLRKSRRDWIDLWLTPYDENLALPLDSWLPDLSGPPRDAVHIRMDNFEDQTIFKAEIFKDFKATEIKGNWWSGYEKLLEPSAKRRDTFEMRISPTHLIFGMPKYDFNWIDADIPQLDWSKGVVQFGHHSYNPTKDCADCAPNTWHWDNVEIAPAQPFTMLRAGEPETDLKNGAELHFGAPAPANAFLRFGGIGQNLEVSFDDGQQWQKAEPQAQSKMIEDHFRSYWMPVPAGTTSVQLRGDRWWGGDWRVRGAAIWALQG